MPDSDKARLALLEAIENMAPTANRANTLLTLAEALAWVRDPGQAHGSTTTISK